MALKLSTKCKLLSIALFIAYRSLNLCVSDRSTKWIVTKHSTFWRRSPRPFISAKHKSWRKPLFIVQGVTTQKHMHLLSWINLLGLVLTVPRSNGIKWQALPCLILSNYTLSLAKRTWTALSLIVLEHIRGCYGEIPFDLYAPRIIALQTLKGDQPWCLRGSFYRFLPFVHLPLRLNCPQNCSDCVALNHFITEQNRGMCSS